MAPSRGINSKKKIFILCLGNQKSGTTWLFEYLKSSRNYASGFTKEYHVFDFKDSVETRKRIKQSKGTVKIAIQSPRLFLMRYTPNYYFRYFTSLFSREISVTGDITPSYSCLTNDRLKLIDSEFVKRDVEVRPILLFRDPFLRIKSSVTMNFGTGRRYVGFDTLQTDFDTALRDYAKSQHCKIRTSYRKNLKEAETAFGDRLGIFFFEELFDENVIRELSIFCNVKPNPSFRTKRIFSAKRFYEHSRSVEEEIRSQYTGEYEYFYDRFAQTQKLWAPKS